MTASSPKSLVEAAQRTSLNEGPLSKSSTTMLNGLESVSKLILSARGGV